MLLPAMLLSNACNAGMDFSYEKGITYQCRTTAKHVAVRAARQLAFKIVGLSCTARDKPLHNRCTFHVEKLLCADFRVCSEVLQLSFETHHRLREKRKIFVSYVLCWTFGHLQKQMNKAINIPHGANVMSIASQESQKWRRAPSSFALYFCWSRSSCWHKFRIWNNKFGARLLKGSESRTVSS